MNLTYPVRRDRAARCGALYRPAGAAWTISLALHAVAGGIFWQHLSGMQPIPREPRPLRANIRTLAAPSAQPAMVAAASAPRQSTQLATPAAARVATRAATAIPTQAAVAQQRMPAALAIATTDAATPAPAAETSAAAATQTLTPATAQPGAPMLVAAPASAAPPPTPRGSTHQHVAGHVDVKYLHTPKPDYPPVARRRGLEGTVLIRVLVDAQGVPAETRLIGPSGTDALDQAALAAVLRWRFVPAREGNLAIAHWVDIPITFRLDAKS